MIRKLAFSAVAGRNKADVRGACQDAVFGKNLSDVSCVALSDGAGSRRLSGTGARRTVRVVVEFILRNFDMLFDQVSSGEARKSASLVLDEIINGLSSKQFLRRGNLEDYACTLIFVAADKDRMLFGHLGDGIAFSTSSGSSEVASWPDNGEFANETYFVTASNAIEHFRLAAMMIDTPKSILLASDGAAVSLLRRSDHVVAPAVARLCEWTISRPRKETNAAIKLNLEGVFREKTSDDCSIAIMADPRAHVTSG